MPDYERASWRDYLKAAVLAAFVLPILPLIVGAVACQLMGVPVGRP